MFDIIGGVGVLRDSMGRMGWRGRGGRYSCMLEIAHNDEDTKTPPFWKNNVMSLGTRRQISYVQH